MSYLWRLVHENPCVVSNLVMRLISLLPLTTGWAHLFFSVALLLGRFLRAGEALDDARLRLLLDGAMIY